MGKNSLTLSLVTLFRLFSQFSFVNFTAHFILLFCCVCKGMHSHLSSLKLLLLLILVFSTLISSIKPYRVNQINHLLRIPSTDTRRTAPSEELYGNLVEIRSFYTTVLIDQQQFALLIGLNTCGYQKSLPIT